MSIPIEDKTSGELFEYAIKDLEFLRGVAVGLVLDESVERKIFATIENTQNILKELRTR